MRSVEREVGKIAVERLTKAAAAVSSGIMQRAEDFAVTHMRSLAFGAAGAVLTLATMLVLPDSPVTTAESEPLIVGSISEQSRVPGARAWQVQRKPVELIALQAPQFQQTAVQYQARSNASGEREDALMFDPNTVTLPDARMTLHRGQTTGAAPSLFIDMTRQQAERGVAVTRAGLPWKLQTKFGEIDAADMTFTDGAARNQSCLAFRTDGAIALSGWYCAAQGAAVERPELACFIDRLTLLKSGDDRDLRSFFTQAEQRRRPCPSGRASAARKPLWLDVDGKAPAMRSDVTGSISDKPRR
jgi:hypothetical protein